MPILNKALTLAPRLAAADGGADTLLAAGLRPDRVVGDMDSISPAARAEFAEVMHPVAEQDSTDFAKALRSSEAPWTLGVGFLGARIDHTLACLSEMARGRARCVLLGEADCVCILPPRLSLCLPLGSRVSLWPLGPAEGRSTGLEWPVDGIAMAPDGRIGTSNRSISPEVTLRFEGAPVALLLPSDAIAPLLEALGFRSRPSAPPAL
ncbi:thiamine diphosphokinase [Jannaschia formosa]|nr:thiamine diphosphokinase [Jannaschia formosa]